ncbi:uncharacterized protein LOC134257428 [Saccostrea cucullata]|uniref:uncharacterized protein LOC134257428 n=1 Tax=Saccostrea cuccullata TaxID=36930 RepID=UPI002ED5C355
MNTGIQNNSEVKTSAEPRKPVTKSGPINFAKAVTTKMQNTKEEEVENIWESVPKKKPKNSFPFGDRPKLYKEEEVPERPVLTTNYANLIPPPGVHASPQKTEKESWDDDEQYLYVSSKLPTAARECYRWKTSAKVVMSANENRNNSAHPSALEQESKTLSCKEHSSSVEDGKKNDVKLNQTDLQRNRPDMPRFVPGSGSLKLSGKKDVNGNIKEEKDQPEPKRLETLGPIRPLIINLVIQDLTLSAPKPWHPYRIIFKVSIPRVILRRLRSQQFRELEQLLNNQNTNDYWNVTNITRKSVQVEKEVEVKKSPDSLSSLHGTQDKSSIQSRETTKPLNQSEEKTESLIASLQRKAYQMTTSSSGSSGAVHDYWAIPTKQPIKTENPNSPSEFFISQCDR